MNRHERRRQQVLTKHDLRAANSWHFATLQPVPREAWPATQPDGIIEVWRSRQYLVQVYETEHPGVERLSICRTSVDFEQGRFADKIPWDDIQRLKSECGRGDRDALEVFPADHDVVNVANLRHVWVMPHPVPFAWRKPKLETVEG